MLSISGDYDKLHRVSNHAAMQANDRKVNTIDVIAGRVKDEAMYVSVWWLLVNVLDPNKELHLSSARARARARVCVCVCV